MVALYWSNPSVRSGKSRALVKNLELEKAVTDYYAEATCTNMRCMALIPNGPRYLLWENAKSGKQQSIGWVCEDCAVRLGIIW